MLRFLIAAGSLLLLTSYVYGQIVPPTPICASPEGYDVANLTVPSYWTFEQKGGCVNDTMFNESCIFFFSFCKTNSQISKCKDSSVCQISFDRVDEIVSLAQYTYDPFYEKDANGFYARFDSGETIINKYTNQPCNVSVEMEFDCDKSAIWPIDDPDAALAPAPLFFSGITPSSCTYYMKFAYAGACYKITPPPTTTAPSTTNPPNPTISKFCTVPSGYDIDILTKPPYWYMSIEGNCSFQAASTLKDQCTFLFAFCKPLENLAGCTGASACARYPNAITSLELGEAELDPFTGYESNGFVAKFSNGATILNKYTNKTCQLSIEVVFDCDAGADWSLEDNDSSKPARALDPTSFKSVNFYSCGLRVRVPYSGACLNVTPAKPNGKLTTGEVFLILFFVAIFVYLSVGMLYNKIVEKESGAKVIPHYDFWRSLVVYSGQGIVYAWKTLTCQNKRQAPYDSI